MLSPRQPHDTTFHEHPAPNNDEDEYSKENRNENSNCIISKKVPTDDKYQQEKSELNMEEASTLQSAAQKSDEQQPLLHSVNSNENINSNDDAMDTNTSAIHESSEPFSLSLETTTHPESSLIIYDGCADTAQVDSINSTPPLPGTMTLLKIAPGQMEMKIDSKPVPLNFTPEMKEVANHFSSWKAAQTYSFSLTD